MLLIRSIYERSIYESRIYDSQCIKTGDASIHGDKIIPIAIFKIKSDHYTFNSICNA